MRRESCATWTFILLILTLILAGAAGAAEMRPSVSPSLVSWEAAPGFQLTLTVSGPGGLYHREAFAPGDAPQFGFGSSVLADGVYTWELTASPAKPVKRGTELAALSAAKGFVSSGSFSVAGGAFVDSALPEAGAEKDQVINDDLIVTFSSCIGNDCVNGESFGFDTLRLKENNLRIHFDDTSNSSSFPNNDWRIIINDSSNGGGNYFRIEDSTAGRNPFQIDAGAPSNSLRVDSSGDVGIGTSNPVVELHVADGDTPTLRLEQNGSSGFTPQTWDVAGNEANFFVRDVTNGSRLSFKIKPGAPENSLFVAADGNVGLGTGSPGAELHIVDNGPAQLRLEDTATNGAAWNLNSTVNVTTAEFRITDAGDADVEMSLDANGNMTVSGNYTATTTGSTFPDYVFGDDYALMSLENLAAFVEREKHLPNIPSAEEIAEAGVINLSQLQLNLLEKIEELTLYTLEQQEAIRRLEADLAAIGQEQTAE
jgi:hypothetical protein